MMDKYHTSLEFFIQEIHAYFSFKSTIEYDLQSKKLLNNTTGFLIRCLYKIHNKETISKKEIDLFFFSLEKLKELSGSRVCNDFKHHECLTFEERRNIEKEYFDYIKEPKNFLDLGHFKITSDFIFLGFLEFKYKEFFVLYKQQNKILNF
jgi:hypothetical protein